MASITGKLDNMNENQREAIRETIIRASFIVIIIRDYFLLFDRSMVDLECYINFWCIAKWFNCSYAYSPRYFPL